MNTIRTSQVSSLHARVVAVAITCLVYCGTAGFATAATNDVATTVNGCVAPEASLDTFFNKNSINRCPLANAGQDLHIIIDHAIPLDASATSDLDGQKLHFNWVLTSAPAGSGAHVAEPRAVKTEFIPDLAGDYTFTVTVTDTYGATAVDSVHFSTGNVAPVANAGPDQNATLGDMVTLDAVRSYDLNETNQLNYRWRLLEQPQASRSALNGDITSRAAVVLDSEGDYLFELTVSDGKLYSAADTVRVSTLNAIPVAHAGRTRTLAPYSTLILDGERSHDLNNDALAYHWSLLSAPEGADVNMDDVSSASPTIGLADDGQYLFQLIVDDGSFVSAPSTVLINVDSQRMVDFNIKDYLALTTRGGGDDTDGDGIMDPVDNCVLVANTPQRDTDGDGIGNFCDADLNNDGIVNFIDISIWQGLFLSSDPDADIDGSGAVNFADYVILVSYFLKPPGPPGTIIWISLVDGDWGNRLNWDPQVVPVAGTTAIIDVAPSVTVTLAGGSGAVKNLVQNENLVLSSTTFEASGAVELGGTINGTATTINNTHFVPSLAGSGTISLNAGTHTWSGNTLGVDTTLNNAALVNNSNGMAVNATLLINSTSSPTGVQFANDQTLSGLGTIVIDSATNSVISEPRLFPFNFTTLTIAPGLTIRGGNGTIGNVNASLILNADLDANVSGTALQVVANTWSSTGTFTAQNGGNIRLANNFDNGGGTLNLDTAGGSINLLIGAALRNAVIDGQPGTVLTVNNGTTTFENVVMNADLDYVNGALTNVTSGLTINGDIQIDAPVSPTGLQFTNDQTLAGTSTITFNGVGNGAISEPRIFPNNFTTLTIDSGITIRGGKGTIGNVNAALILSGNVFADVAGEPIRIVASNWSSTATLTASNGGLLELANNFDNAGNILNLDTAGGSLNLLIGASLRNVIINGTSGTNMTFNNGTTNLQAVVFNADMNLVNGALVNVSDGLTVNGDIFIDAPNSPTGLQFTNDQTFTGTSTITFNGVGNSSISEPRIYPNNFTTLTIDSGITIRGGKGTIGNVNADLVLSGDVFADVAGEPIRIVASNWSSTATLTASNGGLLELANNFDNAGNILDLDTADGSLNLLLGASLRNVTINGTPGTNMTFNNGITNLQAVVFNADMNLVNGALVNVSDGLTVNGDIFIDAPSSPTGLQFTNTQTLGGTATITIDGFANTVVSEPRIFPINFTTLTVGPDVTIRGGKGTIGNINSTLIFQGDLIADVTGEEFVIGGASWSANSLLRTINGGEIRMFGAFDNDGSALGIDAADGLFTLTGGATLTNGTLNGTADTELIVSAGTTFLNTMTFNHDVTHLNGALSNVNGGLTINGTATVQSPSLPTGYQFGSSQTLGGNLSVVFDSAGNTVISEPRLFPVNFTTLTIDPTVTISGSNATIGNINSAVVINGTVDANVDGQTLFITGTNWNGTGSLEAHNGGIIQLAGSINNADFALNFDTAGGSMNALGGTTFRDVHLLGAAGTEFGLNAGTHTFDGLTVTADMTFNNGALANISNGLTFNGTLLIDAPSSPTGLNFTSTQTVNGTANIVFDGTGNLQITEPRITQSNFTTLTIAAGVTISGGKGTIGQANSNLINNGTISANAETINVRGATVTNNGLLEAVSGATLSVDNLTAVNGDLHAGANSNISLLDTLTLTAGSDVFIDIGGIASVGTITANSGTTTYDGTLTVSAVGGYMPNVSDSFALFSHTSGFAGAFSTVTSLGLGGGEFFGLTYNPGDVVATVN